MAGKDSVILWWLRKISECLGRTYSNLNHWLLNKFASSGLTRGCLPRFLQWVDCVFWWLAEEDSSSRSYERNQLQLVSQGDSARSLTAWGVIPHINHPCSAILNAHAFLERHPSSVTYDQIKRAVPLQFGDEARWQHGVTECWGKGSVIMGWQHPMPN